MKMNKEYPELPDRQGQIVIFAKQFMEQNGYSPSLLELADALGASSTFGIRKQLDALKQKGWLTFQPDHSRTLRLTEKVHGGCCLMCGAKLKQKVS
jgi:SOS-response transcriptional repressor LexA